MVIKNYFKTATFNIQGGANKKKTSLADDMKKYDLTALCTTETKLSGNKVHTLTTSDGKNKYYHYTSGLQKNTKHGVGIIVSMACPAEFIAVNDRLCKLSFQINGNQHITIISAYAPTLEVSRKNPVKREEFYDDLESLINTVPKNHILVIGGDMNAKTGSGYKNYTKCMGKRGKGELNENGEELLQMCERNQLFLSNTYFNHKMAHRTTWQSPENQNAKHKDGAPRRNPIRNQIDYMIFRQSQMREVTDSRSYSGMHTKSNHRLVIATMKGKLNKFKKSKPIEKIDLEKLNDPAIQQQFKANITEK